MSKSICFARAAFYFRSAVWIFANQFTFWLRAAGFFAFPITFRLLADGFTFGFRGLTVSYAVRLFADSYTFWAVVLFAAFVGAFNFAGGFFAFYIADGVLWLCAARMAFWWLANRAT